jgi:DNA-binding CsgD family transcriptional regulator
MGSGTGSDRTRSHVKVALEVVHHDRWVLGGLRDGRLRVIAQSPARPAHASTPAAPVADVRPIYSELSPLARRCLYERHPLAVNSIADPRDHQDDWEIHWPALVYAPVGLADTRPVGLLIVGSRGQHWYTQAEIDYVAALGVALTATVASVTGPLGRLTPRERRFALLIAQGLSDEEIAHALELDERTAKRASDAILRKLAVRSRYEVRDLVPGLGTTDRPQVI